MSNTESSKTTCRFLKQLPSFNSMNPNTLLARNVRHQPAIVTFFPAKTSGDAYKSLILVLSVVYFPFYILKYIIPHLNAKYNSLHIKIFKIAILTNEFFRYIILLKELIYVDFEAINAKIREKEINIIRYFIYDNGNISGNEFTRTYPLSNCYSIAKAFTATAIGILYDMGKIDPDDYVADILE